MRAIADAVGRSIFTVTAPSHPSDVAVMMALLKIARLKSNKDNPDNCVDACGYHGVCVVS